MDNELLESWKEISAYLNRNIRTCQYWEKKHGLPVHRIEDSPKARVFAYKKELDQWKKEKLQGVEKKRKIPFIFLVIPLFLAIITIAALLFLKEKKAAPPSTLKPSVVILPFDNNSGDKNLDNFRWGLSNMLFVDMSQSKHVFVFPRDHVDSILQELDLYGSLTFTSEDLKKITQRLSPTHIVQGSYIKFGDTFRIDIDLKEAPTIKSLNTKSVEGPLADLSLRIDELTIWIKSNLNLTDEALRYDIDARAGLLTTSHPEAYNLYIDGRNLHNINKYDESIEMMNKAIGIDPEFSLAYRSVSESYANLGRLSKSREYALKALKFNDRISEKDRYHFQMQYYGSSEETWDQAIEAGLNLIEHYPDDIGGNRLGELFLFLEKWDRAIEIYQVLVSNQEISYFPYRGIASAYSAKGMYNTSSEILTNYLKDIAEDYSIRWSLAFTYLCQGQFDMALEEANKIDPCPDLKGYIFHCSGQLEKAEREYYNLLDSRIQRDVVSARRLLGSLYLLQGRNEEAHDQLLKGIAFADEVGELSWQHEIHSELAYFYLATGETEKALEECNSAFDHAIQEESIRRQIESLHLKGLVLLDKRSIDEAEQTTAELKKRVDNWPDQKLDRYYSHLMGRIEYEKKDYLKAIAFFKNAIVRLPYQHYDWNYRIPLPHALFYESLALAYSEAGEQALAEAEYRRIKDLTAGKLWFGDIHRRSGQVK